MKKKNNVGQNIFVIVLIAVGIILSFYMFYNSNVKRISGQNESYINDITTQRANLIQTLFEENLRYIESASIVLDTEFKKRGLDYDTLRVENEADIPQESLDVIKEVLGIYEKRLNYTYLRFIDINGRDYTSEDKVIQAIVSDREYFRNGIVGKTGMLYILDSRITYERQVGFYAPLYSEGEIVGVAVGFYGEQFMHDILSMTMFEYDCEVILCDENSKIIYNTFGKDEYETFIERTRNNPLIPDEEHEVIVNSFKNRQNAIYYYRDTINRSVGYIAYLGNSSDWFIVMRFPNSAYSEMIDKSNLNGIILLTTLISIFLTVGVYYAIKYISQRKRIMEEAKNSNDIHSAMSLLFENFVIVNAETGKYNYIEGMPEVGEIPKVGTYEVFVSSLLSRFPIETEKNEALKLISFDNLIKQMNEGKNILSFNLHAPIYEEEWFTYNFIVVAREHGKVKEFIIARQDITNLQKKEEKLRSILEEARDAAEKGNKAKTDFLSNMSHDIRTPMNAIVGYTNIAKDYIDDSDRVKESLDKISSSSQYLLSLINDILDMSKIESGNVQIKSKESDLNKLFERIADITRSQSEKKQLNVSFDVNSIEHNFVKLDELRIEQILINIISNAIKYTPEGKDIYIIAREIDYNRYTGKAKYEFTIRDTGIGINKDFLPHIFESFSREKNSKIDKIQGTGLGLAITSKLVELMDGKIYVNSEVGKGTEFIVVLSFDTYDNTDTVYEEKKDNNYEKIDLTGIRVLLVEDNDINAEIATVILSQYGIKTDRAADGMESIEILKQKGDDYYQAILMDIQMPVMNGYEATRNIRKLDGKLFSTIPIIAMSANAYDEDVRSSIEAGMNAHIAKPFDPNELVAILKKFIVDK